MLYYKFLHESERGEHSVLKSCIDGRMKFSLFGSMKDRTETFVSIDGEEIDATLNQIVREGIQSRDCSNLRKQLALIGRIYPECNINECIPKLEGMVSLLGMMPSNMAEMVRQILSIFTQNVVDDIQKRIGILCITKVIDNQRMWEEYADNAGGFVIEYEGLESLFVGDETGVFDRIKTVNYVEKRLPIRLSACDFERLFYTKLTNYEFEKESRVIKVLSECDDKSGFIRISPERYIKRVIVGWNCPDVEFAKIKEVASCQSNGGIPVARANLVNGHIQM